VQLNVASHKRGAAPSPVQHIVIPGIVLCWPVSFVQLAVSVTIIGDFDGNPIASGFGLSIREKSRVEARQ
jgi:hypothetical protein